MTLLTAAEVAAMLRVTPERVLALRRAGALREALTEVYEWWKGRPDLAPGIRLREKVRAALTETPEETR